MAGISVVISASDNATGIINKVNTGIESLSRRAAAARAPMDRMAASLGRFGQLTGISQAASDVNGLGRQIGNAAASLGRFAPALGAITGAASVAGLASLVERWTAFGSRLGFDAQRIGMTAAGLHGLQGAARLAGSSAEALTSGMQSLGDNLTNAVAGRSPETVAMLSALGINFRDTATGGARLARDVLPEIADKISRIENPTRRAMAATALLGAAGESLLPLFTRGAQGIRDYNAAAESYGVFSQRGVQAAQALREEQTRLSLALDGVGNSVSESVAPVLVPMLRQLSDWVRDNRGEIAGFFGTIARAIKDWTDDGGLTRLIDRLKAVYDTLARIVGIADSVGHGLRKAWDTGEGKRFIDEYGNPIGPAGTPIPGLPPPATSPTVLGQGHPGWIERNMPTWLGGRPAPAAVGSSQTIPLAPGEREQNARAMSRVFMEEGKFTREGAAAFIGSGIQESGLNPRSGAGSAHQAIFQWSDARRAAIEAQFKKPVTSMTPEENARAALWELDNKPEYAAVANAARTSHDLGAINHHVTHTFEAPGNYDVEDPRRLALSKGVLDRLNADSRPAMYGAPATQLPVLAAPVPPVPASAPPGSQGQPGPDGKATVRLQFDNPPPGMRTTTVAQGGLRVETPTLGAVP